MTRRGVSSKNPRMTITREDPRFWDVRTLERRIRKGHLNRKDLDKHLKGLPDVTDKGQAPVLEAQEEPEDDYDDEEDEMSAEPSMSNGESDSAKSSAARTRLTGSGPREATKCDTIRSPAVRAAAKNSASFDSKCR